MCWDENATTYNNNGLNKHPFFHFYRPHPKDGEGTVFFTGVCLSTPGKEGYPSPSFFLRPLVLGPFWGGYPSPSQQGTPVLPRGIPRQGYPPGQDRT